MSNYILEYLDKIESGEIIVCKRIRQQYERLVNDILEPRDPWMYDNDLALDAIEFIETFCKHSKGEWAGKPLTLDLWQKARASALYGFVNQYTGIRKYNERFTVVARKNGKSTDSAGNGEYMLVGDGEAGAEIYTLGTKKDQARIVFTEMCNMVSQSSSLASILTKRKSDLYMDSTFSKAQPLASDSNSLDGLNVHYAVMDEMHAWKSRDLYDVIKQATAVRRQPVIDIITTAGFVRESVYDQMYEYACNVLDGIVEDEHFLAFIYELDDKQEWLDPDMWIKANPGLGTIKPLDYLKANVERAKNDASFLPTLLTKDFNIRETTAGSWLTFDVIDNPAKYDMEWFRDCYSVGGVDLSSTTDLTAAVQLLMRPDDPIIYCLIMFFIPEAILDEKVKKDKVPYDKWAERGLVTLCKGAQVDYRDVTNWFTMLLNDYDIRPLWIGYDPWHSTYWLNEMLDYGFNMEVVRQGAQTMSQPMKELSAKLAENMINYDNNPILKWCLTNTTVERDKNDNIRPTKKDNQRLRIDGTVAMINAYVILLNHLQDYLNMI